MIILLLLSGPIGSFAQSRLKGKRLDTTQAVLRSDTVLKKLVEFRDSLTKVGPAKEDLREPEPTDNTAMFLLLVGSLALIIWAGRRAWMRRKNN